ncbi:hypothetical protein [Flammeovirga sp. SubArs3]|uniref:hypothetical protein n=1 Tax=Flammeovirga sp. SubArs3 TaxID=2995316 RepID=UPI00248B8F48|nr:hypothetical protein [Flammeovirga sp. SubArs3]
MKRLLFFISSISLVITSCQLQIENPITKASVSLQATGFKMAKPIKGAIHHNLDNVDSVFIGVQSLQLQINDSIIVLDQHPTCYLDLLNFHFTDTLLWSNETVPYGYLGENILLQINQNDQNDFVVEADGKHKSLELHGNHFTFRLLTESQLDYGDKYIIKLDMMNSVQMEEISDVSYYLFQGQRGIPASGTARIIKTEDYNEYSRRNRQQ